MIKCPSRTEALDKHRGRLLNYVPCAVNFIPASRWGRGIFKKRTKIHQWTEFYILICILHIPNSPIFFFTVHWGLLCPSATTSEVSMTGEMSQITGIKEDFIPDSCCKWYKSPLPSAEPMEQGEFKEGLQGLLMLWFPQGIASSMWGAKGSGRPWRQ